MKTLYTISFGSAWKYVHLLQDRRGHGEFPEAERDLFAGGRKDRQNGKEKVSFVSLQ